jgi:hypothetical protein
MSGAPTIVLLGAGGLQQTELAGYPEVVPDDTLAAVKLKLVKTLKVSPQEMYFFGEFEGAANAHDAYMSLSQGGTLSVPRSRMLSYLSNVFPANADALPARETYTYDDLLVLDLGAVHTVLRPIGLGFNLQERYPVVANPFDTVVIDPVLAQHVGDLASDRTQGVLLAERGLKDNKIYVVIASSVGAFAGARGLNPQAMLRTYFPVLAASGVSTPDMLSIRAPELLQRALGSVEASAARWAAVGLMRDVVARPTKPYARQAAGFTSLALVVHPAAPIVVPLEAVFKLLRTNADLPMTKLNPGARLEKLYRLRAVQLAQDGKRVPDLTKTKLSKLATSVARDRSVGAYVEQKTGEFIIQFTADGDVGLECRLNAPTPAADLVPVVQAALNPLLQALNTTLRQTGYEYPLFAGFDSTVGRDRGAPSPLSRARMRCRRIHYSRT